MTLGERLESLFLETGGWARREMCKRQRNQFLFLSAEGKFIE